MAEKTRAELQERFKTGDTPTAQDFTDVFDSFYSKAEGEGVPGMSAYEIWLQEGHTGDEQAFLDDIKGPKGDKGDTGEKGDKGDQGDTGASFIHTNDNFLNIDVYGELSVKKEHELIGTMDGSVTYYWDVAQGTIGVGTVTGDSDLIISNTVNGECYTLMLLQDGAGGAVNLQADVPIVVVNDGGGAIQLSSGAGKVDMVLLYRVFGAIYVVVLNDFT